jgi:hypothetical protein
MIIEKTILKPCEKHFQCAIEAICNRKVLFQTFAGKIYLFNFFFDITSRKQEILPCRTPNDQVCFNNLQFRFKQFIITFNAFQQ